MRAVIQRVTQASVSSQEKTVGKISTGLVVLVAIHKKDTENTIKKMVEKIIRLRIFEDDDGKMNYSSLDIQAEILLVSQFTLYGDCRKGNRPSFIMAALPEKAKNYYEKLLVEFKKTGLKIETGIFRTAMQINLTNNGPTTIILEI